MHDCCICLKWSQTTMNRIRQKAECNFLPVIWSFVFGFIEWNSIQFVIKDAKGQIVDKRTHARALSKLQKVLCMADVIYNSFKLSSIRTLSVHKVKTRQHLDQVAYSPAPTQQVAALLQLSCLMLHCTKLFSLWNSVWHTSHRGAPTTVHTSRPVVSDLPCIPLNSEI